MASKKNSTSSSANTPTSYRKNLVRSDRNREDRQILKAVERVAKHFDENVRDHTKGPRD